jgi:bromodomain adjacent to zinc finger domain protein 1A
MDDRYYARVEKVYPPKYSSDARARDAHKDSPSSSTSSLEDDAPHILGGDLKIPTKDAIAQDNPALYFYWVHILELEKDKSHDKSKGASKSSDKDGKMVGSLMEVQCGMMRYEQFAFTYIHSLV